MLSQSLIDRWDADLKSIGAIFDFYLILRHVIEHNLSGCSGISSTFRLSGHALVPFPIGPVVRFTYPHFRLHRPSDKGVDWGTQRGPLFLPQPALKEGRMRAREAKFDLGPALPRDAAELTPQNRKNATFAPRLRTKDPSVWTRHQHHIARFLDDLGAVSVPILDPPSMFSNVSPSSARNSI